MEFSLKGLNRGIRALSGSIRTRTLDDFEFLPDRAAGGFLELEDCLIIPGAAGIHNRQGQPIMESHVQRGPSDKPIFPLGQPKAIEMPLDGHADFWETAIVLPALKFHHFGHLLTETAGWLSGFLDPGSRLLELARKGIPIIIMGEGSSIEDSHKGVVKVLDMPPERILLSKKLRNPVICRRIFLPQPTMVIRRCMEASHLNAAFEMTNRWFGLVPPETPEGTEEEAPGEKSMKDKIYLSRSKMPDSNRKMVGEERLEVELERCGWRILHPETLPIREQIRALNQARFIAGTLGSAFHLLMYLGHEARGKTVIALGTERIETERHAWTYNFVNQFRLQGIDLRHLSCLDFDASPKDEKTVNIFRHRNLKPIRDIRSIARSMGRIADV